MPTPVISMRLAKADQKALAEMANVYGSPNPSAFLREMVVAMCSNDMGKVHAFLSRLTEKISGQMTLQLQEQAVAQMKAAMMGKKKRRPRERTT